MATRSCSTDTALRQLKACSTGFASLSERKVGSRNFKPAQIAPVKDFQAALEERNLVVNRSTLRTSYNNDELTIHWVSDDLAGC